MQSERIILFEDSEVAIVTFIGTCVHIEFSATRVSLQNPERDNKPVEGYARAVELILMGTAPKQANSDWMGKISSGTLRMENKRLSCIPLPCAMTDHLILEFSFANQSYLKLEATGLECRFTGEPNFFESMAC